MKAINAYADGFDWDESADCWTEWCWAEDADGWGFHNSSGSTRIRHFFSTAVSCGNSQRGGFDQYAGASGDVTDCTFIGCRAVDCYQNFDINSSGATIGALRSEGTTTVADDFSGVSVSLDDTLDLSTYPDATGQTAGKIARTDGADGWTFVDSPSGGATVLYGATPQSDGSLRFTYGVDASGRPTYTAAGTTDTEAIVVLDDDGRIIAREVTL